MLPSPETDMNDIWGYLAGLKLPTVAPALAGAAIAVLLEFKRHTWATAILALVSGAFLALVGTEPIVHFFNWPVSANNAVAGVLGISGRNLIVWLLQVSKDPLGAWRNRD